jgi:GT2 family glycosyltransferase
LKTLIVVLNWNSRDMTKECIQSLLAMERDSFKILVIDNGSRDGSVEYLRETFPQVEVAANGRNLGFAAGCNVGMTRAVAENFKYVLLVNNDTIVDPALLRELLQQAEENPKAGIVSPKIYYFKPPDAIWWVGGTYSCWTGLAKHVDLRAKDTGKYDAPRNLDWATGCVMLCRTESLAVAGLFDEQIFGNGEDVDLSLRMRKLGYVVRYAPAARVWHKEGIDYKKNVGEYVRTFTLVRNLLWLMHKHAKPYQWITFWPVFAGYYLPKLILLSASRGDFRSCWAVFQGVAAFWKMLLYPGISVLPAALTATTLPILASENTLEKSTTSSRQ